MTYNPHWTPTKGVYTGNALPLELQVPRDWRAPIANTIERDQSSMQVRGEPLDPALWTGRQWAVTTYGLERRDGTYPIEAERLAAMSRGAMAYWPQHMAQKRWVDIEDFCTAWLLAIFLHDKADLITANDANEKCRIAITWNKSMRLRHGI